MVATITAGTVEAAIVRELPALGVDPSLVTRESSLEDLDVDSLDLAELAQALQEEFGVKLGRDVEKVSTLGELIDLVVRQV